MLLAGGLAEEAFRNFSISLDLSEAAELADADGKAVVLREMAILDLSSAAGVFPPPGTETSVVPA